MNIKEIKNYLELNGAVLFGSRAWGGFNEYSDYDYLLPLTKVNELKIIIQQKTENENILLYDNDYYVSGYYIKEISVNGIDEMKINVTVCKFKDYPAWLTAIEMMKKAQCSILLKDERQMLFETILSILKKTQICRNGQE